MIPSVLRRLPPFAFVFAALFLVSPTASHATPIAFDFYDRGPYRPEVPRPAAVLGYEPGTFHTSYGNMERYIDALIRVSPDRVRREAFGRTYEFRERALLVIASPENLARIDAIRAATARLADPRGLGPSEAARLIETTPVTVWLNYSIHGDESASFEAMMQVAYQLVAGQDSTTRAVLEHCVVLLNLAHNPDGHERFVTWINALGSGNPDPFAIEQQGQQPWGIGGRTNHYQVDLNRDALAMSQVESRQLARAFRRWNPQVFVDHHGQTASYFFAPPAPPINPALSAAQIQKWTEVFGRANSAAFDRYGWNYYVRDVFDLYYPGYWDSWPSLHGAVGMTYETDGGGNLAIRRDDETVVTLLDGIRRHFTASIATCAAAAAHREERLRDFSAFAREAIADGQAGAVRAYAWEPGVDPVRAAALAEDFLHNGVEVRWVEKPFRAASVRPVWDAAPEARRGKNVASAARTFERGAFVVDLAQPAGRLARTLLERDAPIDSAFARAQFAKYERNRQRGKNAPNEPYDFYDVTAWSLPVAYGIPAYGLGTMPTGGVLLAAPDPALARSGVEDLPDSMALAIPMPARVNDAGPLELRDVDGHVVADLAGAVEGGPAGTAYVWACDTDGAARLALRLLQEDFRVATTTRPLRAGGRDFPRGSFIARVERNPAELHARIAELTRACGARVLAVHSAYTDQGDTGVGSEAIVSLKRPNVAVLVDAPVSPSAYGWLWFLFERRLGFRFTALRAQSLGRAELERYNVVVVPDGSATGLASALGAGGVSKLKTWIQAGGTLVCLDDAAEFPTLKDVDLSTARAVGVPRKEREDAETETEPKNGAEADSLRELERRPQYVPGTVFWATLDPRHFLAFGYHETRLPVLMQGRLFLKPSREGVNPARFEGEHLALSGWTWPDTERRLRGTAYAVDEPTGDGHVVMIAGSPAFRLFWRLTERMLVNAILYCPALD